MTDPDRRIHPAPYPDWYATQDTSSPGVWICDRATEEKVKVEPPAEWGRNWSWNITQDGKGVYFRRTGQEGEPTEHTTHET
jgi:hypothetical protein